MMIIAFVSFYLRLFPTVSMLKCIPPFIEVHPIPYSIQPNITGFGNEYEYVSPVKIQCPDQSIELYTENHPDI